MEKELPLVSVVVPCYNHERYVEECIMSIINQTYKNIELIVIDDGSSDNSPKILKRLSEKYNFYFEHQKNMGLPSTLNKALTLTSGEYITFLASDDYISKTKIEKQIKIMLLDPTVGLCYGRIQAVDNKDNYIDGPQIFKAYKGDVFKRLLFSNFIPAPSILVKRVSFNKVGAFDPNIKIEDWYMWLKIAKHYKIDYIDEVVAYYRQHDSNFSKNYLTMLKYDLQIINLWKKEGVMYFLSYLNAFRRYIKNRFFI